MGRLDNVTPRFSTSRPHTSNHIGRGSECDAKPAHSKGGSSSKKDVNTPSINGAPIRQAARLVYPAIYEIWKWNFGLKRSLGYTGPVAEARD